MEVGEGSYGNQTETTTKEVQMKVEDPVVNEDSKKAGLKAGGSEEKGGSSGTLGPKNASKNVRTDSSFQKKGILRESRSGSGSSGSKIGKGSSVDSRKADVENLPPNAALGGADPGRKQRGRVKAMSTGGHGSSGEEMGTQVKFKGKGVEAPVLLNSFAALQEDSILDEQVTPLEGRKEFPALIKDLKYRFKLSVLALLETRISGSRGDKIINKLGFSQYFKHDAVGFAGGIWLLWEDRKTKVEIVAVHTQFIHTKILHVEDDRSEFVTFVYGNPRRLERQVLWDELELIAQEVDGPWVVLGDFNSVQKTFEKIGGKEACWNSMREMNLCLASCDLEDIGFKGPNFTWKGENFRKGLIEHDNKVDGRQRPFRFLASWMTMDGFEEVVENSWNSHCEWNLARNEFERRARDWHHNVYRLIARKKNLIYARLRGIDNYRRGRYDHSMREKEFLAKVPTCEEIRGVIFRMGKFKALGPDGLQAVFFQKHWHLVGESVKGINTSLICLIPKKDSPDTMKEFRPISLCNVVYKVVTKIITERLRGFMPRVVGPNQCSFIKGRQSADNIIIAQEVVHSMKEKKGWKGWMMIKVDLEKAYDRLSWKFIKETLEDVGLHKSLSDLIVNCISSSTIKLLWNGDLIEGFNPQRGIRQGDPVSPYLFVLCVERLAHFIQLAVDTKAWKPIMINKYAPPLSHLFFADDIILCAEASMDQAFVINQVLKLFSVASGQKVSEAKSRVFFSKNVGFNRAKEISECLGVGITNDLGKYLGVNLNHRRVSKNSLNYVVERVHNRLSSWSQASLSLAGRITLAKAVLEALPAYIMQTTDVPISICKEVEKLTRGFIWGSSPNNRKVHLVNWENVCRMKEDGGLGLRNQRLINKAYAMKIGYG
ncbi:uncharacterized protein LOC133288720 [Gastrolobium bilobum]|uniref:uncharacterized protein LOC133288720 n=1 Tax=Gastrolobium bilobum TaxID=150636 RepID=UPI002AAF5049|nr:uncharacterized protein LOC133288720 [Gastrolobium bilobum]